MNSHWRSITYTAGVGSRLVQKELRQNLMIYLSPILFYLPFAILALIKDKPIQLDARASIAVLVVAFIFAIIYGLQSFAGETDRKTLDFLLSRPISPSLLITIKFLMNLGVYLFWIILFTHQVNFNWSILKLPKGVNSTIIVFILPIILSMGFFSGLIARGAERLVVTIGLVALTGGINYLLWNQAFLLMSANYYWFDIPPHIIDLISRWLPGGLLLITLFTPLVFSLWILRGRYSLFRFKPLHRLAYLWATVASMVMFAASVLGPAIWPLTSDPRGGDWHPQSGVIITGTYFQNKYTLDSLYIAKIGGKPHLIYKGSNIHSARWSSDGKSILFVDGPWIKLWHQNKVKRIVEGSFPYWSHDGQSFVFVRKPDKHKQFAGIYVANIGHKSFRLLYASPKLRILSLTWDSLRNRLYILHQRELEGYLEVVNLTKLKDDTIKVATTPPVFVLQNPIMTIGADGKLFLATVYEHESHLSVLFQGKKELTSADDSQGSQIDMLSQAIPSPTGQGYLIPRMDGAYDYKGIIPPHEHHDGDDDEHTIKISHKH